MKLTKIFFSLIFLFFSNNVLSKEDVINLQLKDGIVKIKTLDDKAPNHVQQIKDLVSQGKYDGVVFHRVIDGFMAQTGDVQFGNSNSESFDLRPTSVMRLEKNCASQDFSSLRAFPCDQSQTQTVENRHQGPRESAADSCQGSFAREEGKKSDSFSGLYRSRHCRIANSLCN